MRRWLKVAAIAATVALSTLAGAPAYGTSNANTISVSPSTVAVGSTVTIEGSVSTQLCVASDDAIAVSTAALFPPDGFGPETARDVNGFFSVTYTVPSSTPAGTYQIGVRCGGGNVGVTATLRVTAVPPAPRKREWGERRTALGGRGRCSAPSA